MLLVISNVGCTMNELIGKPYVYQSKEDNNDFKINYTCYDPDSFLLGNLFDAKNKSEKICDKDQEEAKKEAIKFCQSKKLSFSQVALESTKYKTYVYNQYNNSCGSLCSPTELRYTLTFRCLNN